MPHDEETPRLGEINRRLTDVARTLADFRNEIRGNFSELVRKDTYTAEQNSIRERLTNLETRHNRTLGIMYTSIASAVVAIFTLWITRAGT